MTLHDLIILMTLPIGGTNISVEVQWNTIRNIQVNTFCSYKYINIDKFVGKIPKVFNVVLFSSHGYFGQADVLGLPDTRG